jgi:hypothetical protein
MSLRIPERTTTAAGKRGGTMVRTDLDRAISELQHLRNKQAEAIRLYDKSPDGSEGKREARRRLDMLSPRIVQAEWKIERLVDEYDEEED